MDIVGISKKQKGVIMKLKVKDLRPGDKIEVQSIINALVADDSLKFAEHPQKPKDFYTMTFQDYYSYERDVDYEVVLGIIHNTGDPKDDGYDLSTIIFEDFYVCEETNKDGETIICEYPNPIWNFRDDSEFQVVERGCDPVPTVTTEEYIKKHGKHNIRREEYEDLDV